MRSSRKHILIVSAIIAGLIVLVYITIALVLRNYSADLERRYTRQDVERAVNALHNELSDLETITFDYAAWDDTYAFVENANPQYIQSNFQDQAFIKLDLSLVAVIDSEERLVYAKGFDWPSQTECPVPSAFLNQIAPGSPLLRHAHVDSKITGFLFLSERPLLVASQPILNSNYAGPIRGTLIMGRFLDADEIARLSEITNLTFTTFRFNDPTAPPDVVQAQEALARDRIFTQPLDEQLIGGYTLLLDIYDNPAILLRVTDDRDIYAQEQTTERSLLAALGIIGLIFSIVVLVLRESLERSRSQIAAQQATGQLLQNRIDSLQILSKIEQDLSTQSNLAKQIDLLLDFIIAHLRTDFAAVSLLDPMSGMLNPMAIKGPTDPKPFIEAAMRVGQGAAGWVAEHGQPLVIPNVWEDPRWLRTAAATQEKFISYFGVPLQSENQVIGVIDVMTRQPRDLTSDEIEFLTALAARASIAIQNTRLYEQTRQRATELEALRQASLGLTSTLDLNAVLNAVLENLLRLRTDAQNTHIYLYQEGQLTFGAALWADGRKGQQYAIPRPNGLTATVARQGKMIVVPDMANHPLFANLPHAWQGAIVGLPLQVEQTVLGVMNVAYTLPHSFDATELNALQLFADQAAIAIANARLHRAVQESEARYRSLVENIPIAVYRVTPGPQGKFLMANPAHLKMFGFESFAELQQIDVSDLYIDPNQRKAFSDLLLAKGRVDGFEQRLKRKDGKPIWVMVTAQAIYPNGEPAYFDCTSIDITVRKQEMYARTYAEDALRQRTRELEALLEVSNSSTYLDLETVLTVVANRARNLLQATEATLFLMDEKENLLRPIVALGDFKTERLALRLHPGEGLVGWVAEHREALVINHAIGDPRIKHVPGTPEEDESMLCAPLIHGAHLQGIILLNRIPPIGFMQSELDLLVGLAAQASAAIANARLFEETRRNALEQKIVSEISVALNSSLDVPETFPLVVKGIRALTDCDRINLALLDPDHTFFSIMMLDEPDTELRKETRIPVVDTACSTDIKNQRPHFTPDLSTEINFASERALFDAGYRSRIIFPLIVGERTRGALSLSSRKSHGFDRAPLVPLQQIANILAIALENAQLFQAELTRREELATLYSLSRQLAEVASSEAVLPLVAQHIVDTVQVTYARIALIDEGDYVVRAVYPLRPLRRDLCLGQREPLASYPFLRSLLQQSTPTVLQRNDPRVTPAEAQVLFLGFGHTLCIVPLLVRDHAVGFMLLGEERTENRSPFTPEKVRLARNIGDQAASALHRMELYDELENAYLQTVLALANAVDAKDSDTNLHSQRLAELAILVGRKLGLNSRLLDDIRYGAILHDIGKIGVPDAVLKKASELTPDEWHRMHQHPVIGERILAPLPRLANAAKIVRHHHERFDGTGYPDQLVHEQIPIGARILAVVDAYGAILDKRVYKESRTNEQALEEILRCNGTQFDPQIVDIFIDVIKEQIAEVQHS
ncbi:MAG: GAF domain-containing protein [Chloroflexi bacterium]|nr:GAF domain-containing protein [Chloroflexota bacterium]